MKNIGWHLLVNVGPRSGSRLPGRVRSKLVGRCLVFVIACRVLLVASSYSRAQTDQEGEYMMKLAFLYNMEKFVDWPSDAFRDVGSPFVIGVVGKDPFAAELEEQLRKRTVQGRPVVVKRFRAGESLRGCQIVFATASEKKRLGLILGALNGSGALTVGETKGFLAQGGMVNFVIVENKLRFEINLKAATHTGLRISSKLLALARIVDDAQHP